MATTRSFARVDTAGQKMFEAKWCLKSQAICHELRVYDGCMSWTACMFGYDASLGSHQFRASKSLCTSARSRKTASLGAVTISKYYCRMHVRDDEQIRKEKHGSDQSMMICHGLLFLAPPANVLPCNLFVQHQDTAPQQLGKQSMHSPL